MWTLCKHVSDKPSLPWVCTSQITTAKFVSFDKRLQSVFRSRKKYIIFYHNQFSKHRTVPAWFCIPNGARNFSVLLGFFFQEKNHSYYLRFSILPLVVFYSATATESLRWKWSENRWNDKYWFFDYLNLKKAYSRQKLLARFVFQKIMYFSQKLFYNILKC